MAQLSITVTNSINFFGGQVTYKWGSTADKSLVWGTGRWGDGDDMLLTIEKNNSNSIIVSNVILNKDITKVYSDAILVSSVVSKETTKLYLDSLVVSNTVYKEPEKLIDGLISLNDTYAKDVEKIHVNNISVSGDLYSEEKFIEDWKYVVTEDSANYESRWLGTWSQATNTSSAYTASSVAATSWTTLT